MYLAKKFKVMGLLKQLKEFEKRYKNNGGALTNNFENQIRAKRIRDSKITLGQEALAGENLEQLVCYLSC